MSAQMPQQRLEVELQRWLNLLITHYRPQRILLFGPLAQGRAGESSDIDLIVIKQTDKRFLDRIAEVLRLIKTAGSPGCIRVYAGGI